ncbi:protein phosphatase 2C domain-containing protein [Kitasatospora sp. NPDC056531]|uniref:protein phosphatase 2C domain-containing protein n=1 Tax=Kitasatospora sp. NPDC056531 TaxID=3345856 RepID=UPI0036866769
MSKQGAPAQPPRPGDGWWDTVYDGPAGTLPDTPHADPGDGTVDDWFDTAVGLIGQQRTAESEPESEPVPEAVADPEPEPAVARDSIDDWFDTAIGVIEGTGGTDGLGRQRTSTETHQFPAPSFASDAPRAEHAPETEAEAVPTSEAEEAKPEPVTEPEPEEPPTPVSLEKPAPTPAAEPKPEPAPEPPAAEEPAPEPEPAPAPEPPAVTKPPAPEPEPDHAPQPDPEPAPAVPDPRLAIRTPRAEADPAVPHVGERPPTYGPEPTAVAEADPGSLGAVVPDTALEGAQYGNTVLRAVSVRGDSARYRGEPRRDSLLVTRFGDGPDGLLLAVLAGFDRTGGAEEGALTAGAVAAATGEACRQLAAAIGRSRAGLAADLRDGARDRLRYGLQRLATSAAAPLRALAPRAEGDGAPSPASLHCLMLSLDPAAGYRAAFGVGPGGLYLLRSGHWIDAYAARLLHHPDGQPPAPDAPVPDPRPFRFRLVPATPGDILLLCTPGLAAPVADEPAVAHFLSAHWAHPHPPGTVDFLRQVQVRAKGYADDRTAAAVWTE